MIFIGARTLVLARFQMHMYSFNISENNYHICLMLGDRAM